MDDKQWYKVFCVLCELNCYFHIYWKPKSLAEKSSDISSEYSQTIWPLDKTLLTDWGVRDPGIHFGPFYFKEIQSIKIPRQIPNNTQFSLYQLKTNDLVSIKRALCVIEKLSIKDSFDSLDIT